MAEQSYPDAHTHDHTHEHEHAHDHAHDHAHPHDHCHSHDAAHPHGHVHENQKAVINRLARAIGHLEKVKRMVEAGEDCSEVLIQLAAVKSAVNNTGKLVLKEHIAHCIVEAIENGDEESLRQLNKAIDSFVK